MRKTSKEKKKQLDLVQRPFGSNHEIFVYASIEFGETSALFIRPKAKKKTLSLSFKQKKMYFNQTRFPISFSFPRLLRHHNNNPNANETTIDCD
jgi:glycine betaine/choline ABC-type transport system substrate-binding protein